MFKEYNQDQEFLFPLSLHDFLQKEHICHIIDDVVNELDIKELCDKYSNLGCCAYHPRMMLKVLFYGYAMGERSSRLIAYRLTSDVAYMYLSAFNKPDFRTINRFRKDNIDIVKTLFVQIVRMCMNFGMVSIGTIAIDGTKLKANASYRKTKKLEKMDKEIALIEEQIEKILKECQEKDEEEDKSMGEDESIYEVKDELLKKKQEYLKCLKETKEKLLKEGLKEINLTDEESATMLHKGYRPEPSYNGQIAVEESNGVIVAAVLTTNASDYDGLEKLVEETIINTGEKPSELLADSGYSSFDNLDYLNKMGITGYIPDQKSISIKKGTSSDVTFSKFKFIYNKENDCYICPAGNLLPYKGRTKIRGKEVAKVYKCLECPICPSKDKCTKCNNRIITRHPREYLMEDMKLFLKTKEGRKTYSKRKYLVEPVFGDIKHNRKIRDILLRGKLKAFGEFMLICIAKNLRKVAKFVNSKNLQLNLQLKGA